MRLVLICMIAVITAVAAVMAGLSADTISFTGSGFSGRTSPAALLFLLVLVVLATSLIWMSLSWFGDLPWPAFGSRRTSQRRARDALARGLIAVEGGDAAAATKYAARAERLIAGQQRRKGGRSYDHAISLLLAARAAQSNEDWAGAERAYAALAREKGANLAGLRGLAAAAMTRGDQAGAKEHVRTAMHANKQLAWPLVHLFDLQLAAADWSGARATIDIGLKRKLIETDVADRRRCALLTVEAARRFVDAPDTTTDQLETALKAAPFPPAAEIAARLKIASGHPDTARRIIRAAWRRCPHPALATLWSRVRPEQTAHDAHLEALATTNPDHRDSRILMAEADISRGDWSEAEAILRPYLEQRETDRSCYLMEMIARGRGDAEAASVWARRAMRGAIERGWTAPDVDGAGLGSSGFDFTDEEWARLIISFGDSGVFSDPRYPDRSEFRLAFAPLAALPERAHRTEAVTPPVPDHVPDN